ncbi:UNVERIFIED_CONTAM: hypothetical protein Sradi_7018700 [Sesamum radiatum]|uniref:Endonuclease/exonuclease/phosphatase domain-containing protein n=1 Tax=Sesamum radiatum TaxID=300843 RepID=A0AAW2JBS3_SESRA
MFGLNVDACGKGGGLILLWPKDINLVVHSFSSSHIDAGIANAMGMEGWRFTGVYEHPEATCREETWNLLRRLSHLSSKPWLCAGDFNEILLQEEKTGAPRPRRQIEDFRSCLAFCQLADLGYSGHKFTWCNHREAPNTVRVRLDRACATLAWQHMFRSARVSTETARSSDHNPLVIELEAVRDISNKQRRKLFRFEAMWTRSAECEAVIQDLWSCDISGEAGARLSARTSCVREGLIAWDKSRFGHVRRRIKDLE